MSSTVGSPRTLSAALAIGLLLGMGSQAGAVSFEATNLVSDEPGVAQILDPNLKNAWGSPIPPRGPSGSLPMERDCRSSIRSTRPPTPLPSWGWR